MPSGELQGLVFLLPPSIHQGSNQHCHKLSSATVKPGAIAQAEAALKLLRVVYSVRLYM